MQTIITKYLPPTNTRGSRIKAKCWLTSVTIPYPYEVQQGVETHKVAADTLVAKMNADRKCQQYQWAIIATGDLPDQTGHAFIIELKKVQE